MSFGGYYIVSYNRRNFFRPDGTISGGAPDPEINKVCIEEICLTQDPEKHPDWMKALSALYNADTTSDEHRKAPEENSIN